MRYTDLYRHQHADIMQLVARLEKQLDPAILAERSMDTWRMLSELGGKITVHLAGEDRWLYPELSASSDPAVKATAARFSDEMGFIAKAFQAYEARWTAVNAIKNDPQTFVTETQGIIKALGDRIRREHSELYPLADRLESKAQ